jgi:hypothetical protein
MKNLIPFILLSFVFCQTRAQDVPGDSGVFLLHKFEQHIGKETYKVYNYKDQKKYVVDFKFVDRGSPVPLKATLKVNPLPTRLSLL